MAQVQITGVTGGLSSSPYLFSKGQFLNAVGIDPDTALTDDANDFLASGVLRPTAFADFSGANVTGTAKWITTNPKNSKIYALLDNGRFVSYDSDFTNETLIATASTCTGNGLAYYNNYIYVFRNTDVDRYGPLDGTPSYSTGVWTGATLGSQTALNNTTYPTMRDSVTMPNHVAFVHSDGALYFCDFVNGQGVIHKIKTSKTTDEGDTNNGSSYNVLDLPFGYYPTCITNLGTSLVIGAIQTTNSTIIQGKASLFTWNAIASSFSAQIPISDPIVSAVENANGFVYVFSGGLSDNGYRVGYIAGSSTVKGIYTSSDGHAPLAGALDASGDKLYWGTTKKVMTTSTPEYYGVVISLNSKHPRLPLGLQVPAKASFSATSSNGAVASVKIVQQDSLSFQKPIFGWKSGSSYGIDKQSTTYGTSIFHAPTVQVGRKHIIRSIRLNLAQAVAANMTITATVFTDNFSGSSTGSTRTINNTNYANSERVIEWKDVDINVVNNFVLELRWSGTALAPIMLPITMEVEPKLD